MNKIILEKDVHIFFAMFTQEFLYISLIEILAETKYGEKHQVWRNISRSFRKKVKETIHAYNFSSDSISTNLIRLNFFTIPEA